MDYFDGQVFMDGVGFSPSATETAMGLHTGTIKGLRRAPYRTQVLIHLIGFGLGEELTPKEEAKIERVARFLDAYECAKEIEAARETATVAA
jgi:hypothetical protein